MEHRGFATRKPVFAAGVAKAVALELSCRFCGKSDREVDEAYGYARLAYSNKRWLLKDNLIQWRNRKDAVRAQGKTRESRTVRQASSSIVLDVVQDACSVDTAWRLAVESWLLDHGHIAMSKTRKCCPVLSKIFAHN